MHKNREAIVIGSDQVAWREHAPHDFIGKPLTIENAKAQLAANSGRIVFLVLLLSVQCLEKVLNIRLLSIIKLSFAI